MEENAEWIVEDFEENGQYSVFAHLIPVRRCSSRSLGGLVPFANFGTVTFTDATATSSSGTTTGPSGATIIDIEQNNQVLTSCSASSSSVTCSYV